MLQVCCSGISFSVIDRKKGGPVPAPLDHAALQLRLDQLHSQLASIREVRPGSLNERFLRCGKASCRCAARQHPGPGPYWSLTFKSGGKTVTRSVPHHALERTRQQIAEYKRFRTLTAEFVEVSEQLCQARLTQSTRAAADQAKKKR